MMIRDHAMMIRGHGMVIWDHGMIMKGIGMMIRNHDDSMKDSFNSISKCLTLDLE